MAREDVLRPDETRHEFRVGPAEQLVDRPDLLKPAVMKDGRLIRDGEGFLQVVTDVYDRQLQLPLDA